MQREHKKKLTSHRRIIVNHLIDLESVLDYLIANQVFTPAIRERIIRENRATSDQIRQTLDCLTESGNRTRNARAYQCFLEALVLTGNRSIANVMEPDYLASDECRTLMDRERLSFSRHARINSTASDEQPLAMPIACTQQPHTQRRHSPASVVDATSSSSRSIRHLLRHNQTAPLFATSSQQQQQHAQPLVGSPRTSLAVMVSSSSTNTNSSSRSSSSTSSSMSPASGRSRSSSVTPFLLHKSSSAYMAAQQQRGGTRSMVTSVELEDDDNGCLRPFTPSRHSMNVNDDAMLSSPPASPSPAAATYNIDWSDVNRLELDFQVTRSVPNIRKQLAADECYQMEQMPRGICLIINNEHFYEQAGAPEALNMRRVGTDMDASRLANLFQKLNFHVHMHVDLTELEMRQRIHALAAECELKADLIDAICLIVLTHGTDGYLHGCDINNKLNIDNVLNIFDDVLVGKPKLFIFQACRGEHLNQKDNSVCSKRTSSPSPSPLSSSATTIPIVISPPPLSTLKAKDEQQQQQQQQPSPQTSVSEDETVLRNFRQLKMSSTAHCTKQLMFKKNTAQSPSTTPTPSSHSTREMTTQTTPSKQPPPPPLAASSSLQPANDEQQSKTKRSRSNSRSKYTAYLASAATAIRSVIKTSPNATKAFLTSLSSSSSSSLSTPTTPTPKPTPISEFRAPQQQQQQTHASTSANCYMNSNIFTSSSAAATNSTRASAHSHSLMNFIDGRPIRTALPSRSDFFIWYSSVRGFVSHRDVDGSPFIKCLVTVFSRCAYELELIEMVRKVNMLMQQYEKRHFDERNAVACYFMMPVAEYHLAKLFYFNP